MLASVPKGTRIIVVDNFSDDLNTLKEICSWPGVLLIENVKNEGFGTACNRGVESATTEFIFLLNPDCVLMDNTIDELILAARRNPKAMGFNPRIMNNDGKPSFNYKSALLPRSKWMERGWPNSDCHVSILSGSAMFIPRTDFVSIRGFDPNIFLYHEDDDLALRLNKRGPLIFVYDALISHSIGASSGGSLRVATFKAWHLGYSRIYAMRKHNLPFASTRSLMRAILKAISPAIFFSYRKRAIKWSYLKGVVSYLLKM